MAEPEPKPEPRINETWVDGIIGSKIAAESVTEGWMLNHILFHAVLPVLKEIAANGQNIGNAISEYDIKGTSLSERVAPGSAALKRIDETLAKLAQRWGVEA